jgi:predicted  nucleic acid-binding Zn-ribbon protein
LRKNGRTAKNSRKTRLCSVQFQTELYTIDENLDELNDDIAEIQFDLGNTEELKTRVAKMLLAFINIMRKNKNEIDISYDNIAAAIRKRKEKRKTVSSNDSND